MTGLRRASAHLRLASDKPANELADAGPDSMTRQSGVAGAGPGRVGPVGPLKPTEISLRILATTDLHANILSYDYAGNRPHFGQGLAQTASLIAAARAEVPQAILVDNGDFLQGSALADLAARDRRKRVHPSIAAFNALGYDAVALGNHEFNFGLPVLERAVAAARFPVVSANVLRAKGDSVGQDVALVQPYALVRRDLVDGEGRRHSLCIGILGLTPPEILRWDRQQLEGHLQVRPMVQAARAWAPLVRKAGADLVLCLAHTGIAVMADGQDADGLAAEIATVPDIDLLVAGHSHLVFPPDSSPGAAPAHADPRVDALKGLLAGKPAVQPGFNGSHLGVIDLALAPDGPGWKVARSAVRAVSVSEQVAGLSPETIRGHAAPLRKAVGSDHRAALARTRRAIGAVDLPMSTSFAQVADVAAMKLVAAAKIDYTRRMLAGGPHEGLPIVATATPYRSGGRGGPLNYTVIARGALSERHLFDLYPFPNTSVAIVLRAADLAEQMERAVAIYRQVQPGRSDQPLLDPAFSGFAFATFHGFSYRIDLTQPARYDPRGRLIRPLARRISDLQIGGRAVHDDDRFVLATNNFRVGGSLGIAPPAPQQVVLDQRVLLADILRAFIQARSLITAADIDTKEGWAFHPMPGTTVSFDTGVMALDHLEEAAALRPELVGVTEEGLHRFRLQL